jgi:DNA helicase IV
MSQGPDDVPFSPGLDVSEAFANEDHGLAHGALLVDRLAGLLVAAAQIAVDHVDKLVAAIAEHWQLREDVLHLQLRVEVTQKLRQVVGTLAAVLP